MESMQAVTWVMGPYWFIPHHGSHPHCQTATFAKNSTLTNHLSQPGKLTYSMPNTTKTCGISSPSDFNPCILSDAPQAQLVLGPCIATNCISGEWRIMSDDHGGGCKKRLEEKK